MGRPGGPGPLDPIFDVPTQYGAVAVGATPATGLITVTLEEQPGQDDPVVGGPVFFDVVFSEDVTGFTGGDLNLFGSALPTTAAVTGSGDTYVVEVTGMTVTGTVRAVVRPSTVTGVVTGDTNRTSTSIDNTINWELVPEIATYDWDFSVPASVTSDGTGVLFVTDVINGFTMQRVDNFATTYPSGTQNGLNFMRGVAAEYVESTIVESQPIGVQWVGALNDLAGSVTNFPFQLAVPSPSTAPQMVEFAGNWDISAGGTGFSLGAADQNWHVWYIEFNGASSRAWRDDVLIASGTVGGTATNGITWFNAATGDQNTQNISIGQLRIIIGVPSDADRSASNQFLMSKWGI